MPSFKKSILFFSCLVLAFMLSAGAQVYAGYGEPGTGNGNTPVCGNEKPGQPWLYALTATGTSQATLYWDKSDLANSFTVAYGTQPGTYIWGLYNFGTGGDRTTTINYLPPGTYYFAIRGNNGCMPGPFSNEKSVRVGGGVVQRTIRTVAYTPPPSAPTPPVQPVYQPPVVPPVIPTVAIRPTVPVTPVYPVVTPQPSFWQGIVNYFKGLLGIQ